MGVGRKGNLEGIIGSGSSSKLVAKHETSAYFGTDAGKELHLLLNAHLARKFSFFFRNPSYSSLAMMTTFTSLPMSFLSSLICLNV